MTGGTDGLRALTIGERGGTVAELRSLRRRSPSAAPGR
jgi:hypothetical protein